MLTSNDLAELIESTRDRVKYMGGDSPAAAGVVQVLNGLITVLRDQVQEDDSPAEPVEAESETAPTAPADEPEPPSTDAQLPGYLQHLRSQRRAGGARRRPVRESLEKPKPANPLLNPQYAGFFNDLIAQQKAPESRPPARKEDGNAEDAPPDSAPPPPAPSSEEIPPRTFRDETATG